MNPTPGDFQPQPDGGLLGLIRNTTEDRARVQELEEARRKLMILSEAAGIGTWSYEPGADRLEWSQEIQAIVGASIGDEATPDQFQASLHPDERLGPA